MPQQPCTTVRRDANRRFSKGEISLLLRSSIYVVGRRKPRAYKECVGRPHALHALERRKRMHTSERPIRPRTRRPRSDLRQQLPYSVTRRKPWRNLRKKGDFPLWTEPSSSAITKKSVERSSGNQLPQADNSQIMPRTRNTRTTADFS